MCKPRKKISYGNKDFYIVSETLNYYYVSSSIKGNATLSISKKDYAAYHKG